MSLEVVGSVVSVNVGRRETVGTRGGLPKVSGISKRSAVRPVRVGPMGLEGDVQVDEHHGGSLQALYAYAEEDLAHWSAVTCAPYDASVNGENLTTAGLDVNAAVLGERWRIGAVVEVQVTHPRTPCSTLQMRVAAPGFVRTFVRERRPGTYLSVLRDGEVAAGDPIGLLHRPAHGVTVADAFAILTTQKHRAGELLGLEGLSPHLEAWARARADRGAERDVA